ncbi:MAG: AEC family transporter [Pseudomonadota bacterium]
MSLLLELLQVVVPVFLIVALGYGCLKTQALPDALLDPLVKFQISVLVPCLLFLAMYRVDLGTAINLWVLGAFFIASTIVFFLAMIAARWFWGRRPGEAVSVGFAAFFPNAVMLGIPITERAFGTEALASVFGIIAFHSLYNYFLGFVMMEAVRQDSETILAGLRKAMTTSLKNPLMMGLLAGMAANLVALPIPDVVEDALDMLAAAAIPTALFAMGGVLTRYRLRDQIGESLMVSFFSLIAQPGLAWLVADPLMGLDDAYVKAAVIMAAMPTGINSYIFATIYNRGVGTAANSVLIGTVLSVISITGWLAFLGGI